MDPFSKLERGFNVSMPTDESGLTGRECPNPDCLGYFKIKFGTGLTEPDLPCHCPYCGHIGEHNQYWTKDQIEYLQSILEKEVGVALEQWARNLDRDLRYQTRDGFIKLSMS